MHATAPVKAADRIRPDHCFDRLGPLLGHVARREAREGAYESAGYTILLESGSRSPRPSPPRPPRQCEAWLDITAEDQNSGALATRPRAHAAASSLEPSSTARCAHGRAPGTSPVSMR